MLCTVKTFTLLCPHPHDAENLTTPIYFLKYDDRVLSLSFLARAPDCKPNDASSSITFPKLKVNTPTPPITPMANNIGTYTGGNSSITNSVGGSAVLAAKVMRGVSNSSSDAVRVDIHPVTSARC